MNTTPRPARSADTLTITPADFDEFATYGPDYAAWFLAMGDLQQAVNDNQTDAAEGLTLAEQVEALAERLEACLTQLRVVADADPMLF